MWKFSSVDWGPAFIIVELRSHFHLPSVHSIKSFEVVETVLQIDQIVSYLMLHALILVSILVMLTDLCRAFYGIGLCLSLIIVNYFVNFVQGETRRPALHSL